MNTIIDNYLDNLQEIAPVLIGISAVNTILMATNMYKKHFTKAALRCKSLPDREKAICMLQAKIYAKKIESSIISSKIAKCSKVKNPEKCKNKLTNKIKEVSTDIKNFSNRVRQLKSQKYS